MSQMNRKARSRIKKRPIKDVSLAIDSACSFAHCARRHAPCHSRQSLRGRLVIERTADIDVVARAARLMVQRMLRETTVIGFKVLQWDDGGKPARPHDHDVDAANAIGANSHVFGIGRDIEEFPPTFKLAADGFVSIPAADASAVVAASRAIGFRDLPEELLAAISEAPMSLLGVVVRPGAPLGMWPKASNGSRQLRK